MSAMDLLATAIGAVVLFPIPVFAMVFGSWGLVKLIAVLRNK